ncbi:U1A/U2B"/SNF family RNA-binding protein [Sporobolomyces koalae]|uniref:U1A/U2B'/SNF family RNA-binding protein n=1 Tax=Sporobolomyces koalae TaxID=500713 RepID=UPI00317FAE46
MAEVAPAPVVTDAASAPPPDAPAPASASPSAPAPPTNGATESKQDADEDSEMANGTDDKEELPAGATEVLYVNNLNERIKLDIMKQSLKVLFKEYGSVMGVTAHRNLRMRGQAFVTLDTKEAAAKAVKEVQQFPLYGKPMQLAFARTESDALVKRRHPEDMDQHKEDRLKRKKESRRDNPIRQKFLAKQEATRKAHEAGDLTGGQPAVAAPAASARRIVQMPDEYLPPNKILFVQNLPDDTTKETLETLFRPYPNLIEVRTIPGRKNIAFVEFTDEASSAVAREALHNTKQGEDGPKLKVTNAKK